MNFIHRIDECYRLNIVNKYADPDELIGMSDEEIDLVERSIFMRLPKAYTYFLKRMGKSKTNWFSNCKVFFPFFLTNKTEYYEYYFQLIFSKIAEIRNYSSIVRFHDFIFLSEYGTYFLFFEASQNLHYQCENPDPPVFGFDGQEKVQISESFSEWLYNHILTTGKK
jgi:hypothetical protein